VAAVGEGHAGDEEQPAESVRQEVNRSKAAREGGGAQAAGYRQQGHDGGRNHGDQLTAELPVPEHHAADIFEAGAGGLCAGGPSSQAGGGGGQRRAAGAARGGARGEVDDGGNANQVVGGEGAETENHAERADYAEGDRDTPEHGRIGTQGEGYVHSLENAAGIAG